MISSIRRALSFGIAPLALSAGLLLAHAAEDPSAAQDASGNAGAKPAQVFWVKQCGGPNKDLCFIEQRVAANGRIVMVGSFGYKSQTEPVAVITVPLNTLLKSGLALKVDDKKQFMAQFDMCGRQGCRVEIPLSAELIGDLRSGKLLNIGWRGADGKNQTLHFSLTDFATNWDAVAAK